MNNKLFLRQNKITLILFFLNFVTYLNYKVFLLSFILFSFLIIKKSILLSDKQNIYLKLIPINYYVSSFIKVFKENSNSSIFWDMQNFTHYLRCNLSEFEYTYMNIKLVEPCWETIGYGPLSEILIFPFNNIWMFTILLAFIFTLFIFFFLNKMKENILLTVSIFISPGFHFLYFGLSTDIFVVLYLIFILKSKKFEFSLSSLIFLTILTQLKSFPIFIFIGYLITFFLKKQYRHLSFTFILFLINLGLLFNHYFLANYFLPEPMSYTRSFGLLHDYKLIFNHIKYDELLILFLIVLVITFFFYEKIKHIFNIVNELNYEILFIFPIIFFINLYQNWGYKFIFNSIFIFFIYKAANKNGKIFLILVNLFATTYYSIGWGFDQTVLNYFLISISKVFFYIYFIWSIFIFISHLKNNLKL